MDLRPFSCASGFEALTDGHWTIVASHHLGFKWKPYKQQGKQTRLRLSYSSTASSAIFLRHFLSLFRHDRLCLHARSTLIITRLLFMEAFLDAACFRQVQDCTTSSNNRWLYSKGTNWHLYLLCLSPFSPDAGYHHNAAQRLL